MSATTAYYELDTTESAARVCEQPGVTRSLTGTGRVRPWKEVRPNQTAAANTSSETTDDDDDVRFEPISTKRGMPVNSIHKDQWASATVIKLEPDSITCEVSVGDKYWEVPLPPAIFDGEVRYGTPVRIGVREMNGYRMPVVEVVEEHPREDAEIEQLRAQLLAL